MSGAVRFSEEQERALRLDRSVAVAAGAGSGKTGVLAERFLRALDDVDGDFDAVLAVTYTKKAAGELRARVRRELRRRREAGDARAAALETRLAEAWIGTIHAMCLRLLVRLGPGAGGTATGALVEGRALATLVGAAVDEALDGPAEGRGTPEDRAALRRALRDVGRARVREILVALLRRRTSADPWAEGAVDRTVEDDLSPLLAAVGDEAAEHAAAALRLATALCDDAEVRPDVRAFVAAAAALDGAWKLSGGRPAPKAQRVVDSVVGLAAAFAARDPEAALAAGAEFAPDQKPAKAPTSRTPEAQAAFAACVRRARALFAELPDPPAFDPAASAAADRDAREFSSAVSRLYLAARAGLRTRLRALEAHDFESLLEAADRATAEAVAAGRSPWPFRHVLVDEFQDTDPLQWRIFRRFVGGNAVRRAGLCLVGDAKQAIFAFRGGDVATFRGAAAETAAARTEDGEPAGLSCPLADNYRSAPGLVAGVNAVQRRIFARADDAPAYEARCEPMRARRAPESCPPAATFEILALPSDAADAPPDPRSAPEREAAVAVARLKRFVAEGTPVFDVATKRLRPATYADAAVLLRTRKASPALEAALASEGVPFVVAGGVGLFGRPEARWSVELLRFCVDPTDDAAALAVLRSPFCAVADSALVAVAAHARAAGRERLPWWERVAAFGDAVAAGAAATPTPEDGPALVEAVRRMRRWSSLAAGTPLDALLALAAAESELALTLAAFDPSGRAAANVARVVERVRKDAGDSSPASAVRALAAAVADEDGEEADPASDEGGAVAILTEHAAKGLEWPIVVLLGAGEDLDGVPTETVASPFFPRDDAPAYCAWRASDLGLREDDPAPLVRGLYDRRRRRERAAEQARLFYVALTRARDALVVVGSAGAKDPRRSRLRWLAGAVADGAAFGDGPGAARARWLRAVPPPPRAPRAFVEPPEPPADVAAARRERPPALFVPADDAARWLRCPRRVYLERALRAPADEAPAADRRVFAEGGAAPAGDDAEVGPAADPRVRGTILHAAFEAAALGGDPGARASDAAFEAGVADEAARAALAAFADEAVRRFDATPLGRRRRAGAARDVFAETGFVYGAGAVRIEGRPDLVFADAEGVVVVDYKSSAPRDASAARRAAHDRGYDAQLEIYAAAAHAAFGRPVDAALYFAGSGLVLPVVGTGATQGVAAVRARWDATLLAAEIAAEDGFPLAADPAECVGCPHRSSGRCPGSMGGV